MKKTNFDLEEFVKRVIRWLLLVGLVYIVITGYLIPRAHLVSQQIPEISFAFALILIPMVTVFTIAVVMLFVAWLFNF